ncbi:MAG TPA: hypothetical protein VMV29_23880 [Ktedonobacterales bacterium]|nr:hypothetical protein [Ktedonobacterales bacterium]
MRRAYLDQYDIHTVSSAIHQEYWIPAERLAEFNAQIVGEIEVIAEYTSVAQGWLVVNVGKRPRHQVIITVR